MAYNPTTVANYFIKKYSRNGGLTPMKVIKLTYISYGWYLALSENKFQLVDEAPLAWDFGPVFPSLYISLKRYGKGEIKDEIPNAVGNQAISNDDKQFLDKIWSVYGRFDGIYLSALTHREGTPWKKYYSKNQNMVIPDEEIYQHYKAMMKTSNTQQPN